MTVLRFSNRSRGGSFLSGRTSQQEPEIPTNVVATKVGTTQTVSVAFTDPGALATSFTVTSTPGSITSTGSSSPIVVSGLTYNTAYTFTVRGNNTIGSSALSAASNSITPTAVQP